jgi:hypothetical protein
VVVYFSGHGGQAPGAKFIVPADFGETTGNDFRGLTELELSVLQARLTARTRNVVTVLDCCHAARMSREPALRVKALPPVRHDLAAHHGRLIRSGLRTDLLTPGGSPDAVRLAACAAGAEAHEDLIDGRWSGVFTSALTAVLAEAGETPVSWTAVVGRVRDRLAAENRAQRPEAEGPARRSLFRTRELDQTGSFPVAADPPWVRLDGAPFFGHRIGDLFVVMPPGATGPDRGRMLGEVTVDRLSPTAALGRLHPDGPVPLGARAFCVRGGTPALVVRAPHPVESPFVRAARPGEPSPVEVRVGPGGEYTVHDRLGPLHTHFDWAAVVADLNRLGRAAALRSLENDEPTAVAVAWGRVTGGRAAPPEPPAGASVSAGCPIYLTVRNGGPETVWVSLIDIGVTGGTTVLTGFAPSGLDLAPSETYTYGADAAGRLVGVAPHWPSSLRSRLPRPETILALITPEPFDVAVLEQPANSRTTSDTAPAGPLRRGTRPYAVRKITFTLLPPASR